MASRSGATGCSSGGGGNSSSSRLASSEVNSESKNAHTVTKCNNGQIKGEDDGDDDDEDDDKKSTTKEVNKKIARRSKQPATVAKQEVPVAAVWSSCVASPIRCTKRRDYDSPKQSELNSVSVPITPNENNSPQSKCKKRTEQKKPDDKPKRPLSAYNLFFQLERENIIQSEDECCNSGTTDTNGQNSPPPPPSSLEKITEVLQATLEKRDVNYGNKKKRIHRRTHGKIGFGDLARKIAEKWSTLDAEHKDLFHRVATQEKERYRCEMEVWLNHQKEAKKESIVVKSCRPSSSSAASFASLKPTDLDPVGSGSYYYNPQCHNQSLYDPKASPTYYHHSNKNNKVFPSYGNPAYYSHETTARQMSPSIPCRVPSSSTSENMPLHSFAAFNGGYQPVATQAAPASSYPFAHDGGEKKERSNCDFTACSAKKSNVVVCSSNGSSATDAKTMSSPHDSSVCRSAPYYSHNWYGDRQDRQHYYEQQPRYHVDYPSPCMPPHMYHNYYYRYYYHHYHYFHHQSSMSHPIAPQHPLPPLVPRPQPQLIPSLQQQQQQHSQSKPSLERPTTVKRNLGDEVEDEYSGLLLDPHQGLMSPTTCDVERNEADTDISILDAFDLSERGNHPE